MKNKRFLFILLCLLALTSCSVVKEQESSSEVGEEKSKALVLVGYTDTYFLEKEPNVEGEHLYWMDSCLDKYGYLNLLTSFIKEAGNTIESSGTWTGALSDSKALKNGSLWDMDKSCTYAVSSNVYMPGYKDYSFCFYGVYFDLESSNLTCDGKAIGISSSNNQFSRASFSYSNVYNGIFKSTVIEINVVNVNELTTSIVVTEYDQNDIVIETNNVDMKKYENYKASADCSYVVVEREVDCYTKTESNTYIKNKIIDIDKVYRTQKCESITYFTEVDDSLQKNKLEINFS